MKAREDETKELHERDIWNAAIEAAAKEIDFHNNESSWPIESDEIRKLKK